MGIPPALLLLGGASCIDVGVSDPDSVVVEPVVVEERFVQAAYPAVDVLFVVDSTGSMKEEQTGFSAAADDFVAGLDALDVAWQIGVTSMDPATAGALLGRPWILTPTAADPSTTLATNLMVGTASPPPSAGLDAAALALDPTTAANVGFRRADAALHVVFLSDGDDGSGAVLGADPVAAFLTLLADEEARTGHPARASAVVDDGSGACDGGGWDTLPGTRYVDVAEGSGGTVSSICTANFLGVAAALGEVGVEGATSFVLQADPVDDSVVVTIDGARAASGWSVDHAVPALVFAEPPPLDAEIVVRYEIAP